MIKQRVVVGQFALKISDVVLRLVALQKEHGDVLVFIQDDEGYDYPALEIGFKC